MPLKQKLLIAIFYLLYLDKEVKLDSVDNNMLHLASP